VANIRGLLHKLKVSVELQKRRAVEKKSQDVDLLDEKKNLQKRVETLNTDRFEIERLEKERLGKERLEKERLEKERLEKERLQKERLERERLEAERFKIEFEAERLEKREIRS